ncbi:ATP-binding protein [Bartonella sp. HY761]|uniref:ATP-binding protein n=1 Tax=Bartonella sp. HY761 TaxID=2979330 RepID=UPI0021E22892|nr:ATP-binding protein [Bartonella sp. HY761]UXN08008.1 ATP-binding protein [Bartonella sp. HY761]
MKTRASEKVEREKFRHRFYNLLRAIAVLLCLLLAQSAIAYLTLQLFDALPSSITGILEDEYVERSTHQGTIFLIKEEINEQKNVSPAVVLNELQPQFAFRLAYSPPGTIYSQDVLEQLETGGSAFEDGYLYASLDNGGYLEMGPLIVSDVLEANASAFLTLLGLWAMVSALITFAILYIAYARTWREAMMIRRTAFDLGKGELSARVPRIHTEPLKMIGHVINDMATRIELLVNHSDVMRHTMAHEFRTPLARLRFALSMIDDAEGDEKEKLYEGIEHDISELEGLIKVSLDYFRLNNKSAPTNPIPVMVKDWVEELVAKLKPLKPENFELVLNVPDIVGEFDLELGTIALRNIILNCFKYAKSKAVLHVIKDGDAVIFELDDDGEGVPDAFREEVFSPFYRMDVHKADIKNGYGVGLSFVRVIAELHHGSAFVVTSPLGGARFVLRLGN